MTDIVQIEDRGAVRIVAINRPEARNAINTSVLIGLRKAIREAAKAEALRTLVVTGRLSGGRSPGLPFATKGGLIGDPDAVTEAVLHLQSMPPEEVLP